MLWKPLDADMLLFNPVDHVVPGVDLAYQESRRAVSYDVLMSSPTAVDDPTLPDKATCINHSFDQIDPALSTGALTIGHSSGQHNATLRAARLCRMSGCTSTCTPYSASKTCAEFGSLSNILLWHKKSISVSISSVNGIGTQKSQCGYAWGCAIKSCLLGVCGGASFGISGFGASLSISATSSVLSDMSLSKGGFCPAGQFNLPCEDLVGEIATMALDDGAVKIELPATDFKLTRLESSDVVHDGQPVSYLMGEWALLSYEAPRGKGAARVATVSSSNPAFAVAKQSELKSALDAGLASKATTGEHLTLVVGIPPHEANSRKIAMPELKVSTDEVPANTEERRLLVRPEFAEDRSLMGLQILHDSLGGVSHDLALHLEKSLSLETSSHEEHRVVAFLLLSVGATLELEAALPYLPKCCCGLVCCA